MDALRTSGGQEHGGELWYNGKGRGVAPRRPGKDVGNGVARPAAVVALRRGADGPLCRVRDPQAALLPAHHAVGLARGQHRGGGVAGHRHRPLRRSPLPGAARARAAAPGAGGGGQPVQERVPLADEPRAAHPADRDSGLRRGAVGGPRGAGGAARAAHLGRGAAPLGPDQRGPGHQPHRDGADGGAAPGRLARGHGRGVPRPARAAGRGGGRERRGVRGVRRDGLRAGRSAAAQTGAGQPGLQRHQVQPQRRHGAAVVGRERGGAGTPVSDRHGRGPEPGADRAALPALRAPGGGAAWRAPGWDWSSPSAWSS